MTKKFYWLKLKNDFFTTREIKKLRKVAGGDTYTIIYLKMQLLSIKREGLIQYEGTEESLAEQLSLELDEDEDNVKMTLSFLNANNLIERVSEDEYLLNRVPESIGSETGAAERMRKLREKRNNVTPQLQDVQKSDTEIEKETEIDIRDRDKREGTESCGGSPETNENLSLVAKEYEHCGFGTLDMKTKDLLEALLEEYSVEWILKAFEIAVESNKRTLKYARGILTNWRREGGMKNGRDRTSDRKPKEESKSGITAEDAGVISL